MKLILLSPQLFINYAFIFMILAFLGCNDHPNNQKKSLPEITNGIQKESIWIDSVEVDLQYSSTFQNNLLVLPGWDYDKTKWCTESSLCDIALNNQYNLILPQMGKSIYSTEYYQESRKDWTKYPTRSWINNKLIPYLQKNYKLLLNKQSNYIIGLSTGARGAVLLIQDKPDFYTACVALSGDYDQRLDKDDPLMVGIYGSYTLFQERWESKDNPILNANLIKTPLFIGHGEKDVIVPSFHSKVLYNTILKLIKKNKQNTFIHIDPDGKHDFKFWGKMMPLAFQFFSKFKKSN